MRRVSFIPTIPITAALLGRTATASLQSIVPTCLCQEIGLVAIMFFFELLFSYVSSFISFYVSLTNLFSIIPFLIY